MDGELHGPRVLAAWGGVGGWPRVCAPCSFSLGQEDPQPIPRISFSLLLVLCSPLSVVFVAIETILLSSEGKCSTYVGGN